MVPENQFDNLPEAEAAAIAQGFTHHFIIKDDLLFCAERETFFHPGETRIDSFNRVEGESDPDESGILYLIETTSGLKGTLTDAYGVYADSSITAFLKNIHIDRSGTAGDFELADV